MWEKCLQNGINATRNDVQRLMSIMDPNGTQLRASRRLHRRSYYASGPNFVWHVDGNDKLNPYGFGISGCIDGFSRYLLWLNVYKTNKDPAIIAGYFYTTLEEMGAGPRLLRVDAGTENVAIKDIQSALMGGGRNGRINSWIEGTSTLNQRIESFWCHLRKECLEAWICIFHDLKESGEFTGDFLDTNVLRFCFMAAVQNDLDDTRAVWNRHKIRNSKRRMPSGRPVVMYNVPMLYNSDDKKVEIEQQDLLPHRPRCEFRSCTPCDEDVYGMCCNLMHSQRVIFPQTPDDCIRLYMDLRAAIKARL